MNKSLDEISKIIMEDETLLNNYNEFISIIK